MYYSAKNLYEDTGIKALNAVFFKKYFSFSTIMPDKVNKVYNLIYITMKMKCSSLG